ncbi:uncharacterized protein MONBRDRAFT_21943 [Monosiga brevicollis MX1]|uniref:Pyrrolo-quinoline quinone repeat domain-containing protein n=1 Tax=Monosiga brevicollis TaxID=81824 RepID=A9UP28_MONBE|nr:uncharacterized protein MONBRDRAFT_21943 [Monosiga brevicollis MX1]EDQ92802.1 predicted protein [Monosiga brevicollis MX1]|eukprot:XP_001742564.1 hypothetical protein [Monosiga brevicollis MX1]
MAQLSLLLAAAFLGVVAQAQLHPGDWPQFGRTPEYQSFNNVSNEGTLAEWSFNAHDRVVASPAVAGGRVWVGSDNGNMYCFEQATGDLLWVYKTDGAVRSSPAVFDDMSVVFGSYDHYVYMLSANGSLIWRVPTKDQIYAPPTITDQGTVLIGSHDSILYHIARNGTLLWTFMSGAQIGSGPAIGSAWPDRTIFHSFDNYTYAIKLSDGSMIWRTLTPGGGDNSATIVGNDMFIGTWGMILYKMDVETGKIIWTYNTEGEIESHTAYHDDIVYVSAEESQVVIALNATTGTKIWDYHASQEFNGSPSLSRDLVYIGSNDHNMHVLDRLTGELKFKFATCANVFASAAISDSGMVYFACNTATLDAPVAGDQDENLGILYAINPAKHMTA